MAKEFNLSNITSLFGKSAQQPSMPRRKTHLEINLVPDIKNEMLKNFTAGGKIEISVEV